MNKGSDQPTSDCASSSSDGYVDAWRSMESAPKDGTQILVYEPCAGVVVMFYADGAFREKVSMCTLRNSPANWMPLPHGPTMEVTVDK